VRITHLSTYDLTGGAARSAYRLHFGLSSLGHDSRLVVLEKQSSDPTVTQFEPKFDLRTRLRRGVRRRLIERSQKPVESRPPGASYFTDDRSQHGCDVLREALPTDILHLHWIARFIGYTDFFRRLPPRLPLVWTLHDMNPFTGGCHHASACRNFFESCGNCPQLGSPGPHDFSSVIWKRKRRAYARLDPNRFAIVTPSRWLAGEAKRSALMGQYPINVIPYGLDVESFQPRDRAKARELLGVPPQATVLLFVAQWLEDKYKGMPILLEAIDRLKASPDLCLLTIGRGLPLQGSRLPTISLGSISDEERLSFVYSAADIFLLPTLQDNFPNAALEALACGLPVIGSNVGGVPEIVRDGLTGMLVEPANPEALANAIEELVGHPERRKEMSANCHRIAVQEYALEIQARRYSDLYSSLLQAVP
jgi:glycosyltransferase involved in cell wall biosynthesis